MKMDEIKSVAQSHGIKASKMKRVELIHSIQRAEGNQQCFETGSSTTCGQNACLWRAICS